MNTIGEKRVRTEFNPSKDGIVDQIKQKSAELINLMQALRNDEAAKPENDTPAKLNENAGEKLRLVSIAQTTYEEAAMWAVKAATA